MNRAVHQQKVALHPKSMARGNGAFILMKKPMRAMDTNLPQTESNALPQTHTWYRLADHEEAGYFESMTDATLWALLNLDGWWWRIEPVAMTSPVNKASLNHEPRD